MTSSYYYFSQNHKKTVGSSKWIDMWFWIQIVHFNRPIMCKQNLFPMHMIGFLNVNRASLYLLMSAQTRCAAVRTNLCVEAHGIGQPIQFFFFFSVTLNAQKCRLCSIFLQPACVNGSLLFYMHSLYFFLKPSPLGSSRYLLAVPDL